MKILSSFTLPQLTFQTQTTYFLLWNVNDILKNQTTPLISLQRMQNLWDISQNIYSKYVPIKKERHADF